MALSSAPFLSSLIDAAHDLIKNPSNLTNIIKYIRGKKRDRTFFNG